MDRSAPYCLVFDSGMGGLTVVDELKRLGFAGRISYAADTAVYPYGDKSDADLTRRIPRLAEALYRAASPDIFVIACNTASTLALEIVRAVLPIPIVGTVPAIKPAAALTRTGVIGVLATPGTLRRAYTEALIYQFARERRVLTHGSVELVTLAERHAAGEPVTDAEIMAELEGLMAQPGSADMDVIVLACTHFPLLRERFQALLPDHISLIDSGEAIARRTQSLLFLDAVANVSSGAQTAHSGTLYLPTEISRDNRLVKVAARFGFQEIRQVEVD